MGDESEHQPPLWLNSSFIAVALKQEYSEKPVRVTVLTVENANRSRSGLMSRLYRVAATVEVAGEAAARVRQLVVKCSLEAGVAVESSRLQQMFPREALVLTAVLPALHDALRRLRADAWALGPRCLLAARSPVDVLVMEDLWAAGFGPPPDGSLDLPHCRLVVERLARWHAASCALELTAPGSGTDPLLTCDPPWQPRAASLLQPYHRLQFRSVGVALGNFPDCAKYSEKFRTHSEEWLENTVRAVNRSRTESDFKVLVHADVWCQNILFKYQDGKPTDLRFVDFQVSHLASPARDLVFLLYGSASERVHRLHLRGLLAEYHGWLRRWLRALGLHAAAARYPLESLLADVDGLSALALHCACFAPLFTADDSRRLSILAAMTADKDCTEDLVHIYTDPALISYWNYVLPVLESKGAL